MQGEYYKITVIVLFDKLLSRLASSIRLSWWLDGKEFALQGRSAWHGVLCQEDPEKENGYPPSEKRDSTLPNKGLYMESYGFSSW